MTSYKKCSITLKEAEDYFECWNEFHKDFDVKSIFVKMIDNPIFMEVSDENEDATTSEEKLDILPFNKPFTPKRFMLMMLMVDESLKNIKFPLYVLCSYYTFQESWSWIDICFSCNEKHPIYGCTHFENYKILKNKNELYRFIHSKGFWCNYCIIEPLFNFTNPIEGRELGIKRINN